MTNKSLLFYNTFNYIGGKEVSSNVLLQVVSCLISEILLFKNIRLLG